MIAQKEELNENQIKFITNKVNELGSYDAVVVFEAPDHKKAMSFVVDIGIETGYLIETLGAVPAQEL